MRCAFCHDTLDSRARACEGGCGTHLHHDCWTLARRGCPTLGCSGRAPRPRPRPRRAARRRRLSSSFVPISFGISVATLMPTGGLVALAALVGALTRDGETTAFVVGAAALLLALAHFLLVPALWLAQEMSELGPRPPSWGSRYQRSLGLQLVSSALLAALEGGLLAALAAANLEGVALLFSLPMLLTFPSFATWIAAEFHARTLRVPAPRRPQRPAPVVVANLPITVRARPSEWPAVADELETHTPEALGKTESIPQGLLVAA